MSISKKTLKLSLKEKKCDVCHAITQKGTPCNRLAECLIGCDYFCWQHAKKYGTYRKGVHTKTKGVVGGKCRDGIDKCAEGSTSENKTFPCRFALTIFWDKEEWDSAPHTLEWTGKPTPDPKKIPLPKGKAKKIQVVPKSKAKSKKGKVKTESLLVSKPKIKKNVHFE
jgi:hypothetical protein